MIRKAFTLVELLIVIALIAILSVAVLATINPIEQANKAKDSTVQNDAAEVMNAYERYYANSQSYPWMVYGTSKPTVETAMLLRSDALGFGICDAGSTGSDADEVSAGCTTNSVDPGLLISKDELKLAFVGKDEFRTVGTQEANGLWLYKAAGSGGSVYVCYVPKAKSNRDPLTNQLWCLDDTGLTRTANGETGCASPVTTGSTEWGSPATAIGGGLAIFKCVP
ncbi:type II secretion system GspH family protein [Patescibacteria group bacterium]|nr:type II secretion system GspH family protein [Patescibacteria group bacterium]